MVGKASVGAAMLNWRYVGKTFVNRNIVRQQIYKDGPNSKPFRYIEKNDLCKWLKAPSAANDVGRVVWISKDGNHAKVSYVNRKLEKFPNDKDEDKDAPKYFSTMKKIPIKQLTLLDINGNPAESVEVLYTKSGDPMRVTEKGVSIPYQDAIWDKAKKTLPADTKNSDIQLYGKHIANLQDVNESILENIDEKLEVEISDGRIKRTGKAALKWIKNEDKAKD